MVFLPFVTFEQKATSYWSQPLQLWYSYRSWLYYAHRKAFFFDELTILKYLRNHALLCYNEFVERRNGCNVHKTWDAPWAMAADLRVRLFSGGLTG